MDRHYRMAEAAQALDISEPMLRQWIVKAGMRETIQRQRLDYDMRVTWLTQEQLEQLARAHGRRLTPAGELDPLTRLEAVDSALSERLEAIEARVSALERGHQSNTPPRALQSPTDPIAAENGDFILLSDFAKLHGVVARTARWHVEKGLIPATRVGREYRLTPEQQAAALAHWHKNK